MPKRHGIDATSFPVRYTYTDFPGAPEIVITRDVESGNNSIPLTIRIHKGNEPDTRAFIPALKTTEISDLCGMINRVGTLVNSNKYVVKDMKAIEKDIVKAGKNLLDRLDGDISKESVSRIKNQLKSLSIIGANTHKPLVEGMNLITNVLVASYNYALLSYKNIIPEDMVE
jgi:hypothetical protein